MNRADLIKAALAARKDKCFLCRWILEDFETSGTLTEWKDSSKDKRPAFPRLSKFAHLWLEFVTPRTGEGIDINSTVQRIEKAMKDDKVGEAKKIRESEERRITTAVMKSIELLESGSAL